MMTTKTKSMMTMEPLGIHNPMLMTDKLALVEPLMYQIMVLMRMTSRRHGLQQLNEESVSMNVSQSTTVQENEW
jgi:hypothetical protein